MSELRDFKLGETSKALEAFLRSYPSRRLELGKGNYENWKEIINTLNSDDRKLWEEFYRGWQAREDLRIEGIHVHGVHSGTWTFDSEEGRVTLNGTDGRFVMSFTLKD
jgi:hypothetical protein